MGLEDALITLSLLVDDAYRVVTCGGRLRGCEFLPVAVWAEI
jgi:hypothetical protein